MLDRPHDLCTGEPADDASYGGVDGLLGQPGPPALQIEEPDAHDRRQRNEHAEARDLEVTDAEQRWVDDSPPSRPGARPLLQRRGRVPPRHFVAGAVPISICFAISFSTLFSFTVRAVITTR